jgi:hypothetical protein
MESLSPITLRKALDELALPPHEPQARDDASLSGTRVWVVVLAAALCAACAFSVWR